MSRRNNIGYDKRDYKETEIQNDDDDKFEAKGLSRRIYNEKMEDLSQKIHDTIKECQDDMNVPIFDDNDFGIFYIQEYLKNIDIC